jgi:iron complex outermembrane receptor protein
MHVLKKSHQEEDQLNRNLVLKPSVIAVLLALGAAPYAAAQTGATSANTTSAGATATASAPATVYVTGSNIKRTEREGTAPISVVTAQDIKNTGATTVSDLMKYIPSMGTDGNQDFGSGSGFAKGASTASLRGLGSSSTLILLNGRRVTPAPYADPNAGNSVIYDLNSIPVSAIERIEVLQAGASAVYGSDAIAGVINFILKSSYEGAEVAVRGGANDDGNFRKKGFNGIWGKGNLDNDGYSFMITGDFSQRDRTARRDATDIEYKQYQDLNGRFRSDYSSTVSRYATYFRETRPGSNSFGVTQATAPNNMRFDTSCPTSQQRTGSTAIGLLPTSVYLGRTFCNYDADQFLEAQGWGRDINVISHGEIKIGSTGIVGFADVAYSRSDREYTGAPITISTTSVTNFTTSGVGAPFQAILPVGHPDNPFPNARSSVQYRFDSLRGGSRSLNNAVRVVAGFKGSNFGWDWETAGLWNRSERDDSTFGRLYLPVLRTLVTQNRSLASLNADPALGHDVTTNNKSQISHWDARATTEFGQLPGGKIGVAVGAEVRRETINLNPDELVATGQIYGLANTLLNSGRTVKSAFVEFRTPVLKNLEFDFAGRVDKYPNIKTNFVPKVGGKWTVTDTLAVRGTYAEGFRAPSLSQVVAGGAQYFLSGVWDPRRCGPDQETPLPGGGTTQDCARGIAGTGGFNPDLKPEESKSYNLGFVFSPTSNFDMTVDFFRIKRTNEIVLGSAFQALRDEDRFPGNVTRETSTASLRVDANGVPIPGTGSLLMVATPWRNQGRTELGGVDVEARLRSKFGEWGSVSTTLRSTYTSTYKIQQNDGDVMHNVVGTIPGYSDWALTGGTAMPRWKTTLSSTWTRGDHAVNGAINYVGPVSLLRRYDNDTTYPIPFCHYGTRKPTDGAADRDTSNPLYELFYPECAIKEYVTVNLGYTYSGFKNWTLNANVQNLFDTKAPYDPTNTAAGFNEDLHNPYGRYFNFSARYTF